MQWEYRVEVIDLPIGLFSKGDVMERWKVALDRLGHEGWELVTIEGGIHFFKRPIT